MSKCTAPHLLLYLIVNAFFLIHVQANAAGYLFLHFYDNKEQIYGSLSKGGSALDHMMLNRGNPLLTSDVGTKGVRDHFIVSKPDQSQHWILSTDLNRRAAGGYNNAFESRSIVVWASRGPSLTDWNPPHLLPLVPPNFRQAWGPEAIWDASSNNFIIYWSSQEYSDDSHRGAPSNNKIYIAHTRDFTSLISPAHVYYSRYKTSVIDMTIVPTNRDANEYIRFFKDENAMRCMGQVSHTGLFGAWSDIAPGRYVDYNGPGEACMVVQDGLKWYVLTDQYYRSPSGYHPYYASNGITKDGYVESWNRLPFQAKHGSMKALNQAQYNEIKAVWG